MKTLVTNGITQGRMNSKAVQFPDGRLVSVTGNCSIEELDATLDDVRRNPISQPQQKASTMTSNNKRTHKPTPLPVPVMNFMGDSDLETANGGGKLGEAPPVKKSQAIYMRSSSSHARKGKPSPLPPPPKAF